MVSRNIKWLIAVLCGLVLVIIYVLSRLPAGGFGFGSESLTNITGKSAYFSAVATAKNPNIPQNVDVETDDTNAINVKSFNAKGDGMTNDTAAIQAAVDAVPASGGIVVVPAGIYLVDAGQSLRIRSGVTLKMTSDTVLKAIPNHYEHYAVLTIKDVSNVTILGGVIEGERKQHTGTTGEWGMGIRITGSNNITVQNTICKDLWGDGFYIGSGTEGKVSEDVRLIDVQADNNRRQGISLISGRRIEILRPRLTNTNGTLPSAGIDIEPNKPSDVLEEIKIVEPFTSGNAGAGISVVLEKLAGTKAAVGIQIYNHHDDASDRGMLIASRDTIIPGSLLIENPEWVNSQRNGLSIQKHNRSSFRITIKEPRIINANRSGKKGLNGSAIAINSYYENVLNQIGMGNIYIHNPVINASEGTSK